MAKADAPKRNNTTITTIPHFYREACNVSAGTPAWAIKFETIL
jgi:hypothetical protein